MDPNPYQSPKSPLDELHNRQATKSYVTLSLVTLAVLTLVGAFLVIFFGDWRGRDREIYIHSTFIEMDEEVEQSGEHSVSEMD